MDLFRRKSSFGINGTDPGSSSSAGSSAAAQSSSRDMVEEHNRKGKQTSTKDSSVPSSLPPPPSDSSPNQTTRLDNHTPPRQTSIPDLQALPPINLSPFSFPTNPTGSPLQPSPPRTSPYGSRFIDDDQPHPHPRSHDPSSSQHPPTHTSRASSLSVKRSKNNLLLKEYTSLPPPASSRGLALATGSSTSNSSSSYRPDHQYPSTSTSSTPTHPSVLRKASSVDSMAGSQPSSSPRFDALFGSPHSNASSAGETMTRSFSEAPTPRLGDSSSIGRPTKKATPELKELERRFLGARASVGGGLGNSPPRGEAMSGLGLGLGLGPTSPSSPTSSRARNQLPRLRSSRVGQYKAVDPSSRRDSHGVVQPFRAAGEVESDAEYESDLGTSGSEVGQLLRGAEGRRESGGGFDEDEEDDDDRVEVIWQRSPHLRNGESSESSESEDDDDDEEEVGEEEWIQDPTTVSHDMPAELLRHAVTLPGSIPSSSVPTSSQRSSLNGNPSSYSSGNISPHSPFFQAPPSEYALSETGNRLAQNEAEIMASARRKMHLGSAGFSANYNSPPPQSTNLPRSPALLRTSSFPSTSVFSSNGLAPSPPLANPRMTHLQQQNRGFEAALGFSATDGSSGTPSSTSTLRPRAASASSGSWLGGGSSEIAMDGGVLKRGERRSTLPGSDGAVEILQSPRARTVSQLPPIPIAVVGRRGCGKTRIVKEAFRRYGYPLSEPQLLPGLPEMPQIEIRSARVSTKTRINQDVHIYEIDLDLFRIQDGELVWPEGIPRIEAIAICYDAGDLSSWKGVQDFHHARELDIPCCVFGCKSGGLPRPVEVVPQQVVSAIGKLVVVSVEEEKITQKMHQGFCWLVEQAIKRMESSMAQHSQPPPRPYNFPEPVYPIKSNRPYPLQVDTSLPPSFDGPATSSSSIISSVQGDRFTNQSLFERDSPENVQRLLPSQLDVGSKGHSKAVSSVSSVGSSNAMTGSGLLESSWVAGEERENGRSSLGGSMAMESSMEGSGLLPTKKKEGHGGTYLSLKEIVQLLFYHSVRGQDHLFSQTFFACYCRFARPQEVIALFVSEFQLLEGKKLAGVYAQLKICGVLGYWIDHYPNDFAVPRTQGILREMINLIASKVALAHHAAKLLPFYRRMDKLKIEDPVWAKSDREEDPRTSVSSTTPGAGPFKTAQMGVFVQITQTSTISNLASDSSMNGSEPLLPLVLKPSVDISVRGSHSRNGSIVSVHRGRSDSDISSRPTNHSSDGFASSGLPSGETSMSKTSSRGSGTSSILTSLNSPAVDVWESKSLQRMVQKFLDSSDQQIANDITRLDWGFFEKIRPRSLLAHCYSGGSEEGGDVLLRQFSTHFNDLSSLFSILVLSQTKLRARVRIYERILTIIDILRTQNNYMALSSLTASFGQLSVERLRETIELAMDLKNNRNKINRFQSHLKLVDGRSSYKTYKLALKEDERSGKKGVLLIPSIMKELIQIRELFNRVRAAHRERGEGDAELTNWREYERYGEVFHAVSGCQSRGSPVPASSTPNVVSQMLRDRPDIEEKALGDRSLFLEPPSGATTTLSSALRRFGMRHS